MLLNSGDLIFLPFENKFCVILHLMGFHNDDVHSYSYWHVLIDGKIQVRVEDEMECKRDHYFSFNS